MKEKMETLIYKIKIDMKDSINQENLFTEYHTRFDFTINYNNVCYKADYQCNTDYEKPTKDDILACMISDAMCYEDCKINDDDVENLENFRLLFGYENIKDLINAYRGCKNAYNHINKMFTKEEKDMLMKYFEEKGLL